MDLANPNSDRPAAFSAGLTLTQKPSNRTELLQPDSPPLLSDRADGWESRSIICAPYYSCLLSIPQCDELSLGATTSDYDQSGLVARRFGCGRVSLARTQVNILTTSVQIPKRLHKLHIPLESYILLWLKNSRLIFHM